MSVSSYYSLSPATYDEQFWWKKDDLEFWKSVVSNKNNTVLELASGTGRIGIPLVKENIQYTGLDISKKYVDYANSKLPENFSNAFYQGDMRSFNLKKKYDIIIIGFNSFLHLLTNSDAKKCLNAIKLHMKKKSFLYIDMFIPHPLFLYRPKTSKIKVIDFYDSSIKNHSKIEETLSYNSKSEIASVTWHYLDKEGTPYMRFKFKMKMYYPDTINRLLIEAGLNIKNIWGSYEFEKCNEESALQIYKCTL